MQSQKFHDYDYLFEFKVFKSGLSIAMYYGGKNKLNLYLKEFDITRLGY